MNNRSALNATQSIGEKFATNGSRFTIAAILLLGVFLAAGCDSSGTVGDGLRPDDNEVTKTAVNLEPGNMQVIDENTFSGRLQRSAAGYVEDPAYGTLRAVTLLKPSISRATVDTILNDDTMSLKLSVSQVTYGDSLAVSDYTIYEAGEIWRGNELIYNQEVSIDNSTPVATFQLSDEDSIEIELSPEWTEKFRSYFNTIVSDRDSLYINEFPGLAIVPAQTNSRIHFINHLQETDDDPLETEFLVYTENTEDDGDEDAPEFIAQRLGVRDWGSSVVRSDEPVYDDAVVLHNSERILRVDPEFDVEALQNRNIVNATLILTKDPGVENMAPSITRPDLISIRAHEFDSVPSNLTAEMFITTAQYSGQSDEEEGTYRLNITQYVMNEVFGDSDEGPLFISLQAINGFIYSAAFFDETAPDHLRPRIVITSVD